MLKPFLLLSWLLLFASAASSTSGIKPQEGESGAKTPASQESQAQAKKIYIRDCAMCHGDSGDGHTDMAADMSLNLKDWTDPKSLAGKQDQELFLRIRNGKDKMLPEAEDRATDDDVRGLILYIRSFSKPQSGAASKPTKKRRRQLHPLWL